VIRIPLSRGGQRPGWLLIVCEYFLIGTIDSTVYKLVDDIITRPI